MQSINENQNSQIDVLAIAAHRDDVEQTCGGTLLKMAAKGHRTGILDLTRGEMGTRGSAADREREANEAARILNVSWRQALDIPDGRVENTWENRLKIARVVRELRPRVLILPYWQGRHPDHYTTSTLGYEACFLAGLKKLDVSGEAAVRAALRERTERTLRMLDASEQESVRARLGLSQNVEDATGQPSGDSAYRPFKIIYASLYYDARPSFVVDITEQFEARFEALMAYKSQYEDQSNGSDIFPARAEIRSRIESMARYFGLLAGVTYAEPFVQKEVGLIEDVTTIPVQSI